MLRALARGSEDSEKGCGSTGLYDQERRAKQLKHSPTRSADTLPPRLTGDGRGFFLFFFLETVCQPSSTMGKTCSGSGLGPWP
jgi:hypothetical protein